MNHLRDAGLDMGGQLRREDPLVLAWSTENAGPDWFRAFLREQRVQFHDAQQILGEHSERVFTVPSAGEPRHSLRALELTWVRLRRRVRVRNLTPDEVAADELFGPSALPLDEALRHAMQCAEGQGRVPTGEVSFWGDVARVLEQVKVLSAPDDLERAILEIVDGGPRVGVLEDEITRRVEARELEDAGDAADRLADMVCRGVLIWTGAHRDLSKPMRYRRQSPAALLCTCAVEPASYHRRNGGELAAPALLGEKCYAAGDPERQGRYVRLPRPGGPR